MGNLWVATKWACKWPCARRFVVCWGTLSLAAVSLSACVTVRPEQRAILADPTMQYETNPLEESARQHVNENREASIGGGSVEGGGCGCN